MKKLLEWLTGDVFGKIGDIVDDVVTTKEEKLLLKNSLYQMLLSQAAHSDKLRASIVEAEARGNWLQRSWRPILMLSFGAVVIFQFFLYPIIRLFNPEFPQLPALEKDFWELLSIGIGGYVVGRTVEKIVPNINFKKDKNAGI